MKETILCAAIKLREPRKLATTYSDLSICEIGYRHCDIFERFETLLSRKPADQGFFTSAGRFVDRREAARIAYESGQITQPVTQLFSEDIY